ncbi:DUF6483 family protein [Armatimonas rosea]|uniref:Uncharacterized protein n=1 Tax=Armatimonas rosea TaxID=685828 RepID=A0A7W9SU47_ARMRO|nr:DUF6483 family protein [Armatimonas rosea]MBB6052450.1 hypothetical protein [Armatimonas rosea]
MLRKGFVQQQIEGLSQALAAIFGIELTKEDVVQRLGTSCKNLTGLDLDTLLKLDDATLLGMFSGGDRTRTAGNAFVAAQFLLQRAKAEPNQARVARRKALLLYSEALALESSLRSSEFLAEYESLLAEVEVTDRTAHILRQAARAMESLGYYDRAENYHFHLQDSHVDSAAEGARAFYLRLLELPDHELEAGGLPRDEIKTALAELADSG